MDRARSLPILRLAMPIIGGMVSQNVLNLVDTAMVGVLGPTALAAVGLASFAHFMAIAFITGMSAGVQALAARRHGEGREHDKALPLNGGLLLALGLALPWTALLIWATPGLFPLLSDDPAVVAQGVPYLQSRLIGMAAVGMNFAFRGYWNGVNLSRLYLRTILVMHAVNIFLNYGLIQGRLGMPAMGTAGAGLGTAVSTWVGTVVYVVLAWRHASGAGFLRGLPSRAELWTTLRIGAPAGFQQLFMAAGYTAFFRVVAAVGTLELAAANVVLNVSMVALLPGVGLGIAGASLVGQALGRRDPDAALRWGWDVARLSALMMGALGLPMLIFPDPILGLFLSDPAALEMARDGLRVMALGLAVDGVGVSLLNALHGAGATRRSMLVAAACQWGLGLPLAVLAGPVLGLGLGAVWATQVLWRLVQALVLAAIWRSRSWSSVAV